MSITNGNGHRPKPKNVLGGELKCCCLKPLTGYFRDGFCRTNETDTGRHTVCARVTDEFLEFSRRAGNDLITPRPEYDFPGLVAGDKWCLCVFRWREAYENGMAPAVILESCHENALHHVSLEHLREHADQTE
jgi:uncharacterized protein (DUF2237 family)